jgi:hypothetical protein
MKDCPNEIPKVEKRVNNRIPYYVMVCSECEKRCERLPTAEERRDFNG